MKNSLKVVRNKMIISNKTRNKHNGVHYLPDNIIMKFVKRNSSTDEN